MHKYIDKIDKRILFELDKNARIPDTKLAKLVNRSKESVRYRITKLEKQGIFTGFSTWIDLAKIGYTSAKIYLNIANNPKRKQEFIDYVKQDKRLFWLGVADGAWNIGLTYFVTSNGEFFDLKNELYSKFKDLILDNHTGVLVDVNICNKTFLHQNQTPWVTFFDNIQQYQLQDIEKKILQQLYSNGRMNVVEIAANTQSTIDIVRNRMKKLEQQGIIIKYLAKIDFNKLGYEFYKTFLYFKNLTKQDEQRLKTYCNQQPNIIHLVKQISPWDIELEIMCESYHQYNDIINNLTKEFSSIINKTETAILNQDYVFPAKQLIFM